MSEEPTPPGDPVDALVAELEALRRKVDDNAAMIRRNQLSLSELAESLGKLVQSQRRRERAFTLNSFVAYCLFTVLLGGAFFMLYRTRAGDLVAARNRAESDYKVASTHLSELEQELASRDEAAKTAHDYWQLLEAGKNDQAIAAYGTLPATLTPTERDLFAARVKQARGAIVDAGYLAGLDAFHAGKMKDAIPELKKALGYEQEGPRAAQMRYYLGVAQVKAAGDYDDAAHQLELALAGQVNENGVVDARYYLAVALEKLGRLADARAEYDKFATEQPQHPLSVAARRKSAALALRAQPKN